MTLAEVSATPGRLRGRNATAAMGERRNSAIFRRLIYPQSPDAPAQIHQIPTRRKTHNRARTPSRKKL